MQIPTGGFRECAPPGFGMALSQEGNNDSGGEAYNGDTLQTLPTRHAWSVNRNERSRFSLWDTLKRQSRSISLTEYGNYGASHACRVSDGNTGVETSGITKG